MSNLDPLSTPPSSTPVSTQPLPPRFALRNVLLLAVPAVLILMAVVGYLYHAAEQPSEFNLPGRVKRDILSVTTMDPAFVDADGDLVADPPAQALEPATIVFRPLEDDTEIWKGFCADLEKRLGRPVVVSADESPRTEQARQFKAGEIHIAVLSTGTVPTLVNTAGFVPAFCMANDKGEHTYHALIVVPAKSSMGNIQQLKGATLTLTALSSLSSFKAPIQVLSESGLELHKDYHLNFSHGQRDSIEGLHQNRYQAIAVASDLFQRTLKQKNFPESDFRVVYKSPEAYPSACFGYHHALKKDLVNAIRQTFLEYPWDARLQKEFGSAGYSKFVPISYKTDWEPVRKIDERINVLLSSK